MIEKQSVVDKIEVLESGQVQVRTAIRIVEDGQVISQTFHRHVVEKDADLTGEDPRVAAVATAAWSE